MGVFGRVVRNDKPWLSDVITSTEGDSVEEEVSDTVSELVSLVGTWFPEVSRMRNDNSSGHIVNFPRCNEHTDNKNAFWLMVPADGLIGG